jgi:predicted Zn finger-like uncharacterized protein
MIIQCEQCQAKFKLDDSKVTDKGVKVRCAKCKHVFTVTKEQPAAEPQDFSSPPEQTTPGSQEEPSFQAPPPPQPAAEEPPATFSFNSDSVEDEADNTVRMAANPFESTSLDTAFAPAGNDEFSLSSLEDDKGFALEGDGASSAHGEVDFDSFDFGDGSSDADKTMVAPPPAADFGDKTMIQQPMAAVPPPAAPVVKEAAQGLDFSDDDMFGAVVAPPVEEPADSISFDFGTDSFADSMDLGGSDTGQKGSSFSLESNAEAPFSLGEIDFGDELTSVAVQQVNPDELKPSQESLFAPLAEAQPKTFSAADDELKNAFMADAGQPAQDDLPPLSISSRRKQSPLFTSLIAGAAVIVVGALGYFGFSSFSDDKGKVVQETGKISVRTVKAAYVKNGSAGSLLVISGEALNEYPKPRAALQVKGMIYDAKGQVLTSKSAYGGNQLTDEQLATMPLDKIEAAMANQFGDSLANLEVAPGKSVAFTIVIANPPKEGKDFGVEPAGSTEAKGQQQK